MARREGAKPHDRPGAPGSGSGLTAGLAISGWLAAALVLALWPCSALSDITGTASVTDGDTLEIHGERIRLYGIDAPESGQMCIAEGREYRCGQKAALVLPDEIGRKPVTNEDQATNEMVAIFDSIENFLNTNAGAVTAIATIFIAAFTIVLALVTRRIYKHSVASERAYVKMSHRSGPEFAEGLMIDREHKQALIVVQVKNFGRTPADVSDVILCWLALPKGKSPPVEPVYLAESTSEPITAFLVADDSFLVWKTFDEISDDHFDRIAAGYETLWVYGYVDYIDTFGQRHRGGYARQYDPGRARNNLIFMSQSGYNYDRPRKKGEGNDW